MRKGFVEIPVGETVVDLHLYDLLDHLFLDSMGEIGTENRVLTLIKNSELIESSDISRGTFYKYKKTLHSNGAALTTRNRITA